MPSKRKKTAFSTPRHVYTTRQIMDITEQRRQKEERPGKEKEDKPIPVVEELKSEPVLPVTEATPDKNAIPANVNPANVNPANAIPANAIKGFQVFIVLLIAFLLMILFKFPELWVNSVTAKLNSMVLYGSFF